MSQESDRLRAFAADTEALQQRLSDAITEMDGLTPEVSFHLGEAFASRGSAVGSLEEAAGKAARF
ncbi:hypothetical protein ACEZDB_34195 [Streptacidiphilus sp. N1-3]|uniref:Uncharacterized protein n=1 Tax=Streptacidiphilus alkalitolerans TaxID=3342712 RepID=A0ABV6XBR3_9ACTN